MKKPRRKVPPRKTKKPAPPPKVHHRRGWGGGGPGKVPHHPVSHKPAPARKPRKLSPGWDVACCSAQAVGLLLGWDWDQVLGLYWRTASDPDSGASILDTLEAGRVQGRSLAAAAAALECTTALYPWTGNAAPSGLILGVTLPEPHAIAVTPDGTWWSWGQPINPDDWPDLVIEEAWAVLL